MDHQKPGRNFQLLEEAALRHGVSVVGSAPYVEPSVAHAKMNIGLIFDIADAQGGDHVDFHLDYNLDPESDPLIFEVIAQAKKRYQNTSRGVANASMQQQPKPSSESGSSSIDVDDANNAPISHTTTTTKRPCPRITIGHATRLQLFSSEQWRELVHAISDLPIVFVGLPQSDMYMQGRSFWDAPLGAPRGTLRVPYLYEKYGIEIAMSVNNVENAFTPQGSLDPLSLCAFGVGVFQAATPAAIRSLVVGRIYLTLSIFLLGLYIWMPVCAIFDKYRTSALTRRVHSHFCARTHFQSGKAPNFLFLEANYSPLISLLTLPLLALRDPHLQTSDRAPRNTP